MKWCRVFVTGVTVRVVDVTNGILNDLVVVAAVSFVEPTAPLVLSLPLGLLVCFDLVKRRGHHSRADKPSAPQKYQ